MTKKEIIVFGVVIFVILVGVVTAMFVLLKLQNKSQATESINNGASSTSQSPNQFSSLSENSQPKAGQSSSLSVSGGQSTTANLGQLGSNQAAAASGSNSTSASSDKTVPGPETFGQYEQYKSGQNGLFGDILVGTGNEAVSGKKVAMLYKGWLTNGQLFDETRTGSDGKLQPLVFSLGAGQVIRGWEEAVTGMKVGGKRRIIVPPAAGYGATEQKGIPANSVLVFDVELIAIQ